MPWYPGKGREERFGAKQVSWGAELVQRTFFPPRLSHVVIDYFSPGVPAQCCQGSKGVHGGLLLVGTAGQTAKALWDFIKCQDATVYANQQLQMAEKREAV